MMTVSKVWSTFDTKSQTRLRVLDAHSMHRCTLCTCTAYICKHCTGGRSKCTVQCTCTVHVTHVQCACTVYTALLRVHRTLYIMYTVQYAVLYSVHSVHSVHCTLCTVYTMHVQCILHSVHAVHGVHCIRTAGGTSSRPRLRWHRAFGTVSFVVECWITSRYGVRIWLIIDLLIWALLVDFLS